jgi:phosphopantothenoylcysteine decarboxylase/phosphopantothenate--cysteine ligase
MKESGANFMVANDVSKEGAGFDSDSNEVLIIDDNILKVPLTSKREIAGQILDKIGKNIK